MCTRKGAFDSAHTLLHGALILVFFFQVVIYFRTDKCENAKPNDIIRDIESHSDRRYVFVGRLLRVCRLFIYVFVGLLFTCDRK